MHKGMRGSRLPDFYCIGAPRCATTTIYEVLRRQPRIYLPKKEPRFWCADLDSGSDADGLFFTRDFAEYVALYAAAPPEHLVGDMSTWYLFSQTAVPRILDATPNARFVVGIRNPVDLMQSLHAMRLAGLSEDIPDFRNALTAEDDRLRGQRIPPGVRNRAGLLYRRVASTGEQLRRLASRVPRNQFHIYVYEDFRNDPRSTINGILEFLDLDPMSPGDSIHVVNRRPGGVRVRGLRNVLIAPRVVLGAKWAVPARVRRVTKRALDAATLTRPNGTSGLSNLERSELLESFRADIESVSEIIGRDMWAVWGSLSSQSSR